MSVRVLKERKCLERGNQFWNGGRERERGGGLEERTIGGLEV